MNEKQMELIEQKYGKLIHKIGHWISGDNAISGHEDNTQDIWIAAMEAVRGYEKKETQTFDQFWGSKGFDKYIKTCLWNVKNSKGAKITKKFPVTRGTVEVTGNEEVLSLEDPYSYCAESDILFEEFSVLLTEEQREVVKLIVEEPQYIKPSGKANINALARRVGKSWNEVSNIINDIAERLKNVL